MENHIITFLHIKLNKLSIHSEAQEYMITELSNESFLKVQILSTLMCVTVSQTMTN